MYDKLLKLHADGAQITPPGAEHILEGLYKALDALDLTASSILIFNGVLVTAAAFAAERRGVARPLRVWLIIVIIVALISAGLCLRVTHVSWPFLDKVVVDLGGPSPRLDFSQEFQALDAEIALRTLLFQLAWYLSGAMVVLSIPVILGAVIFARRQPADNNGA